MAKHAVLYSPGSLMIYDKKQLKVLSALNCVSIVDVYNVARHHGITHIWVYPTHPFIDTHCNDETYDTFTSYDDESNTIPKYTRIFQKAVYGQVFIGFLSGSDWGWTIETPLDVLATIDYLQEVLGVVVSWSPGHVATELVKHLNGTAKRQLWVRPEQVNPYSLPIMKSATDLFFNFRVAPDVEGMYLHQYDKKSAYLAACLDLFVGAGDAVHVVGDTPIDTKLPGVYRVTATLEREETFIDRFLFPLLQDKWVTSDILEYAQYKGYQVTIHEAHQWIEKHKTLARYAEVLYNSRNVFREQVTRFPHVNGRNNAETTLKDITLRAGGKFASKKYHGGFSHPYWFMAMVGKNYTTMLAHVNKVLEKSGQAPVLAYNDSLYYLSTDSNPLTACPTLFTCGRANGMGKFKHEGTWIVTPELIETFNTAKWAGEIVTVLNKAWKDKN